MELPHFLHWLRELRHHHVRRVFRALATYGVVAFALVEVYEPVMHALHLPEWTLTFVVLVLGIGFPVVAVLAWILGSPVVPSATPSDAEARATSGPRRARLALLLAGVGLLIAAPGLAYYFLWHGRGASEKGAETSTPSIAVLPFADLSPAKDQEYFADGIAEEILNALANVEGLHVPGRTSSFFFKGKSAKLADIGRELNVGAVLEGSVRKEGNRVRVTAQVVDVPRGYHLWSETYDRELTGIFAVQDEIARAVVQALKVKLLPGGAPVVKEHRTTNPEAYNAYLLGRHFFDLGTPDGMSRAVAALEKALALDPQYAPAWAWLSVSILNSAVYLSQGGPAAQIDEAARRATAAADKAVALAPDLADCWSARAWMRTSISWEWAGAHADFDRAIALNPRDANILLRRSHLLALQGRLPEAIALARKVIEIDPLYAWGWTPRARRSRSRRSTSTRSASWGKPICSWESRVRRSPSSSATSGRRSVSPAPRSHSTISATPRRSRRRSTCCARDSQIASRTRSRSSTRGAATRTARSSGSIVRSSSAAGAASRDSISVH